jgi:hypothetical protein
MQMLNKPLESIVAGTSYRHHRSLPAFTTHPSIDIHNAAATSHVRAVFAGR